VVFSFVIFAILSRFDLETGRAVSSDFIVENLKANVAIPSAGLIFMSCLIYGVYHIRRG
jgi:hypothetical protein